MQHPELEQELNSLRDKNPKGAVEHALALAVLYKQEGDEAQAEKFGREAIDLVKKYPTETMADCVQQNVSIAGVIMPDFIHEAVIRERLQPLVL